MRVAFIKTFHKEFGDAAGKIMHPKSTSQKGSGVRIPSVG